MIVADLRDAQDLETYHVLLTQQLRDAHGDRYCAYLEAISSRLPECDSYREIGTWQGASTSRALLTNISYVETIDISFQHIDPYVSLFKHYALDHGIDFVMTQKNSLKHQPGNSVDLMLIDGYHNHKHVARELELYSAYTKKYIVLHDTTLFEKLSATVTEFLDRHEDWQMQEQNQESVGYTVIKKC